MKLASALQESIKALAKGRAHRTSLKQKRATARAAMLKTPAGCCWDLLDASYKEVDGVVKELELAIRERATDIYTRAMRIFGAADKKHWKGVTIKDYTVVRVNPEVVLLEWIRANLPLLIEEKIDMKMFESLVKAGKIPAGIAWTEKDPRAQIASKL